MSIVKLSHIPFLFAIGQHRSRRRAIYWRGEVTNLDKEILNGLEKLACVWPRVTGQAPEPKKDALRELIEGESISMAYYARMASISRGNCRKMALRHLAEERKHLHALQAEFFLRHGDSCPLPKPAQKRTPLLSFLREVYRAELSGAESYRRAALEDASLAALYTRHAADEARHAETLRRHIERAI